MSRLESVLAALLLVAATVLVTEWIHYRLGDPTLWAILDPPPSITDLALDEMGNPTVTEGEFERYLQVLGSMQADRSLAIERAVESVHWTLPKFRDIEQRVQRNETFVHRARDVLRKKAESLWDSRRANLDHG